MLGLTSAAALPALMSLNWKTEEDSKASMCKRAGSNKSSVLGSEAVIISWTLTSG